MIEAEKFSVIRKRFRYGWRNKHRRLHSQQFFYVNEKMIDSFFVKPVQTIESKQHKIVQRK